MDNMDEMARLHSAGATVRHSTPFDNLPSHKNKAPLTADFLKKWVAPYYMSIGAYDDADWINSIKEVKKDCTKEICLLLLGDFNWRTRSVGAYFAAVQGYTDLIDIIGVHLLKSEVCYAGETYALVLAFFNTATGTQYLSRYLDHYLTQPTLYFDQEHVLYALIFLDQQNGTQYAAKHIDSWKALLAQRELRTKNSAGRMARILASMTGEKSETEYLQILASAAEEKDTRRDVLISSFATGVKTLTELSN
ncbi:hypothetical protein F0L74_08965 [Chitinophaga agrisoli]|uniref:Uncharacterized protein n=1 Tax=Chitinophaga agrisoli TaxID=2607653 RepID=A0A5B2VTU5_9BACT|nr:DUF6000 family protein [Chitinophaga agrisoli]KAA2242651.1 hypothetical protein F0L74_08965 [Chitinophaga agrisoli]